MTVINGIEMDDGVDEPNSVERDEEPIQDNPGMKPCDCEDYPCCGH
jgi:hypothetical protein